MGWVEGLDLTFNTKNIASQDLPFPLRSLALAGRRQPNQPDSNVGGWRGREANKGGGVFNANYAFCGSKNFFNLRKRVIFSITPVVLSVSIRRCINFDFRLAGEAKVRISNARWRYGAAGNISRSGTLIFPAARGHN